MQASCRVAQDDVAASRLGGGNGVEHHGGGVRALVLADDVHIGASGPNFELIGSRGAERIGRAQQHTLSLLFQAGRHLANGGGFANAVDADKNAHAGLCVQLQRGIAHIHFLSQNFSEPLPDSLLSFKMLPAHLSVELFHGVRGGVHAEVRHNERFLQLLKERLVRLRKAGEQAAGDFFQFVKKAHRELLFI